MLTESSEKQDYDSKKSDNEAKQTGKSKFNLLFHNDKRETNSSGTLLIGNKMKLTFRETNKKQHHSITENKSEKDQIGQSQIILPSDVLKGKNMMQAVKSNERKIIFIHKSTINLKNTAMIQQRKTVGMKN